METALLRQKTGSDNCGAALESRWLAALINITFLKDTNAEL